MALTTGAPFNVNDTSNTTFTVVAADANHRLHPRKIILSCLTADNLTINFGTTAVAGPFYFGATSGLVLDIGDLGLATNINTLISITKGTNTTNVTAFMLVEPL